MCGVFVENCDVIMGLSIKYFVGGMGNVVVVVVVKNWWVLVLESFEVGVGWL